MSVDKAAFDPLWVKAEKKNWEKAASDPLLKKKPKTKNTLEKRQHLTHFGGEGGIAQRWHSQPYFIERNLNLNLTQASVPPSIAQSLRHKFCT